MTDDLKTRILDVLRQMTPPDGGVDVVSRGIVGDRGRSVSIEHFGASADYQTLFDKFGITTEAVITAARETLEENA